MPSPQPQPSGRVTLLFTDIEGSTRLLHELGSEPYAQALERHRELLRAAFDRHGGYEVDCEGDAFFVTFSSAAAAARAATEAHAALAEGPIAVRIGLHTGEPLLRPPRYVGVDVNTAARIMATAHGGQVVVSEETRTLLNGDVPLRELGWHRLKDVGEPQRLYQLGEGEFPPLHALRHTNLPAPPTPFLGRGRELAAIIALLGGAQVRLLTLTGPGGSGKTRLALEAAAQLAHSYPFGVTFVSLAAVREPALMLSTLGQALGRPDNPAAQIADRRLLLVLDNLEQVVEAAPELARILDACPNVDLLLTSRELLRLTAEHEYRLPPMADAEALELFTARARVLVRDFQPNSASIEICRRLDNLPLALELAATHVRMLTPEEILARLESRLALLTRAPRDAPERHRTLRTTIAWSHDLLSPAEQRLFARLSVFAGGCTLAAAEAVCQADLEGLYALVDKSLLRHEHDRIVMLESIREYAGEELERSGEAGATRRGHAQYYLRIAEHARPHLERTADQLGAPDQLSVLRQLTSEHDNLRAALGSALDWGDSLLGLRLVAALTRFWDVRAPAEGLAWFERALARAEDVPVKLRIDLLGGANEAAFFCGDLQRARAYAEDGVALARAAGDGAALAAMLARLAAALLRTDELERAEILAEEALRLNRNLPRPHYQAVTLDLLGYIAATREDWPRACAFHEQSLEIARATGDGWMLAHSANNLAEGLLRRGEPERAAALASEAVARAREVGLIDVIVSSVALFAVALAHCGEEREAGMMWSAVERIEHEMDERRWQWEEDRIGIEALLGERSPAFERGLEDGFAVTTDVLIEQALPAGGEPQSARRAAATVAEEA